MKQIALTFTAALTCSATLAAPIIRCDVKGTSKSAPKTVVMELNAREEYRAVLNCVYGADLGDITPCAPTNGYGLSAPTGAASLVGVVYRWQDYGDHLGGITSSQVSNIGLQFTGGYYSSSGKWRSRWEFTADRTTGKATLKTDPESTGKLSLVGEYECRAVTQKF